VTGPNPAVAEVRLAVRHTLDTIAREIAPGSPPLALVACSGGADSMALAAAAAFAGPRAGWRVGLVTVDHQLQDGSAERAAAVAGWAAAAGCDPATVATVRVGAYGGPEAAARTARYAALADLARATGAGAVLLGHTRDDQAETVLLALARGAGPHGLAGMPGQRHRDGVLFCRPLLDLPRATCRAACLALDLPIWDDPHNTDPTYARSRVRATLLPALVETLGSGVVANLATSARLIAADTAHLDELAAAALVDCRDGDGLSVSRLCALPDALRTRVLHGWALSLGATGSALSHRHVQALDALVTAWHGQGATMLPGGVEVGRRAGLLTRI
jgi:tRNA(Ile)-lysidine synthase